MHKIRAQSKRQAWNSYDSRNNFNPFGRLWQTESSRHTGDEEHRFEHTQSARLRHAATAPVAGHAGISRPSSAQSGPGALEHHEQQAAEISSYDKTKADEHSEVPDTNVALQGAVVHARRRKLGGLLGRLRATVKEDKDDHLQHKNKNKLTLWSQVQHTFFNWRSLLYPFIPAGFAVYYTGQSAVTIFAINFIAIFPAVLVLADAADELMLRTGDRIGALINSTFSNAVQLITSILLLRDNQIGILQTTLIGTILSSMHLMLGLSFLFGGINRMEQHYNVTVARTSSNLLLLSMVSIILPTMAKQLTNMSGVHVTQASRGISVILILVYAVYLFFQLKTHAAMYDEPSEKSSKKNRIFQEGLARGQQFARMNAQDPYDEAEEDAEGRTPRMRLLTISVVLVICTTLIGFNTFFATDSLEGLMDRTGISPTFVGIVLLPLLSNDITVVGPAIQDKMDICIILTVGKCLQTILLVVPFSVILGWIIGRDMNLSFDSFETVALFASVIYINSMIQDGKSTYLDGVLLLSVFLIICLTSFWVP